MAALDPHDVLKNFEDLHARYNFKEIDYKNFVDTLGGKHPKVDTKNASIVLLTYDKICGWYIDVIDPLNFHVASRLLWRRNFSRDTLARI